MNKIKPEEVVMNKNCLIFQKGALRQWYNI